MRCYATAIERSASGSDVATTDGRKIIHNERWGAAEKFRIAFVRSNCSIIPSGKDETESPKDRRTGTLNWEAGIVTGKRRQRDVACNC